MEETLPPKDKHCLTAAIGWLELKAPQEALLELDATAREATRESSFFLDIQWRAYAALSRWRDSLVVAEKLHTLAPETAMSWIHLSYSLHELGETTQARANLLEAAIRFPRDGAIAYNIACYENRLDRPTEALRWLSRAINRVGKKEILQMAESDPDLESLWPTIREMKDADTKSESS